ncbi:MAG TPA: hypothetical protein VL990_11570 [Acidobacteriaceae bacterium]|nr:hypothetical protein [Acidobacteriaceae bacterium]
MSQAGPSQPEQPDDGTRALLHAGGWMLLAGIVMALLTATVFGGISRQGPHTNAGWLSLMVALMCLPFGLMLFTLGAAKWFRNRRIARQRRLDCQGNRRGSHS